MFCSSVSYKSFYNSSRIKTSSCTVPGFFFPGNAANAGRTNYRAVNKRKKFDFIDAVCLSPQRPRLVLGGIAVLLWIREQIIRLCMGVVEELEQRLPVLRRSVSERAGSAVFQG
ncbi:MAG: hypothetical protein SPL71_13685, partial [Oribacterium sp.]|nr:hypothetical protein [Oribacterium sp.]